ncbi:DUF1284 domain-containing protein [[Clostridium] colinum]|uniref:DUF1284 domain-containing protein n=1 Tax=[Clostridium] colinum TaxID=36835 RepID=UPI00202435E7|nr:DUF1284 domain-containing protein [[Clostridium] colinum]
MIYLRPHHILCIQQFKGYGYNDIFVENMFNILNMLDKDKIVIKEDFDDICKKCPNLVNNICISDNEINLLDSKVIQLLNIEINKPIYFNDLKLYLKENLTEEIFYNICSCCSWYKKSFCSFNNFNFEVDYNG